MTVHPPGTERREITQVNFSAQPQILYVKAGLQQGSRKSYWNLSFKNESPLRSWGLPSIPGPRTQRTPHTHTTCIPQSLHIHTLHTHHTPHTYHTHTTHTYHIHHIHTLHIHHTHITHTTSTYHTHIPYAHSTQHTPITHTTHISHMHHTHIPHTYHTHTPYTHTKHTPYTHTLHTHTTLTHRIHPPTHTLCTESLTVCCFERPHRAEPILLT